MWGIDSNKVGVSSTLILNTTNPEAISLSNKYIEPNAANDTEDSNGDTVKPGKGNNTAGGNATKGPGSGAAAGIVVAAIVVVIPFYIAIT